MELLEKQLELNNEIRAKEELQRECTTIRQQLTETETYVHFSPPKLSKNILQLRQYFLWQEN